MKRLAFVVLLALSVVVAASARPVPVEAHAAVVSSSPAAHESLERSPTLVQITFTERLVPTASTIEVLDVNGDRVDRGDTRRIDETPTSMVVSLEPDLPDGIYTVAWHNISDVDGHPLSGSYVFFVGNAALDAPAPVATVPLFVSPFDPLLRWLVLVGGMLLVGAPLAYGVVLAPAVSGPRNLGVRRRVEVVAILGGVAMLVGGLGQLGVQLHSTGLGVGTIVLDTVWGRSWLIRMPAIAVALLAYTGLVRGWNVPRGGLRVVASGAALIALGALSLASHAAATPDVEVAATLIDMTHILAAALWGGGLVAFLLLAARARGSTEERAILRAALPRFSVLGLVATFTLAVTGAYSAWLQMVTVRALATPYGVGVLVKVILLALLIGLGAVNLFWVRRAIGGGVRRASGGGAQWLARVMRIEVAAIIVALIAAATIASLEPGRQVAARSQGDEVSSTGHDGDLSIELAVRPGAVGKNEVVATLSRRGEEYGGATSVLVTVSFLDSALSDVELSLEDRGDGTWAADDLILSVSGEYQVSAVVQRSDGLDARQALRFLTQGASGSIEAEPILAWRLGVLALALVGVAMMIANWQASRRRIWRTETVGWLGAGVCALALILVTRVPDPALARTNPVLPLPASIAAGREIYQAHCAVCHGGTGRGDGPQSGDTPFPVADLTAHVPLHTDGELFRTIQDGRPNRGMPAWNGVLSETETWHLLNYLRDFTRSSSTVDPAPGTLPGAPLQGGNSSVRPGSEP